MAGAVGLVNKRDPMTIGVNIGSVKWAGGGLTHNLYRQLQEKLPEKYAQRLVSAEKAAAHWGATLSKPGNRTLPARDRHCSCHHRRLLQSHDYYPGVTTIDDLVWFYWQRAVDLGLEPSFRPCSLFAMLKSLRSLWRRG